MKNTAYFLLLSALSNNIFCSYKNNPDIAIIRQMVAAKKKINLKENPTFENDHNTSTHSTDSLQVSPQITTKPISQNTSSATTKSENKQNISDLENAIKLNDPKKLIDILKANPNLINQKNHNGMTPLELATKDRQTNLISLLVLYDCNITAENNEAIMLLVQDERTAALKIALDKGVDVNTLYIFDQSLLEYAVTYQRIQTAKLLLSYGANVNQINKQGNTLLGEAILNGDTRMVEALLNANANPNQLSNNGSTPLAIAQAKKNNEIIALVTKAINSQKKQILLSRVTSKNIIPDINAIDSNGLTALHRAIVNNQTDTAISLIRQGADLNVLDTKKDTPLNYAIYTDNLKIALEILAQKVDPNKCDKDNIPLHLAARYNNPKIASALISAGADINRRDAWGNTPLILAAQDGNIEIVKILLEANAALTIKNNAQKNVFDVVIAPDYQTPQSTTILQLLQKANIDKINSFIAQGATSERIDLLIARKTLLDKNDIETFIYAIKHKYIHTAQAFIDAGIDLNTLTQNGESPLTLAVINGQTEIVKLFLENGANIHNTNELGMTPLDLALSHNHIDIVDILISEQNKEDLLQLISDNKIKADEKFISILQSPNAQEHDSVFFKKYLEKYPELINKEYNGYMPLEWTVIMHKSNLFDLFTDCQNNLSIDYQKNLLDLAVYNFNYHAFHSLLSNNKPLQENISLDKDYMGKIIQSLGSCNINIVAEGLSNITTIHKSDLRLNSSYSTEYIAYHSNNTEQGLPTQDLQYIIDIENKRLEDNRLKIYTSLCNTYPNISTIINNKQQSLLHLAIQNDIHVIINFLLNNQHMKNVNQMHKKDNYGYTPFDYAIERQNIHAIKSFVKNGYQTKIDTNTLILVLEDKILMRNTNHNSRLYYLICNDETKIAQMLIPMFIDDITTDINTQYIDNNTFLHMIAKHHSPDIAQMLIEAGANLNSRNKENNTPLDEAAYAGNVRMVDFFIENYKDLDTGSTLNKIRRIKKPSKDHLLIIKKLENNHTCCSIQ